MLDHSHNPPLVGEAKDQGDCKFARIRSRFPQTKDLVDSPQKRSKQPQAEDQSGGSSLFLQTLVDLAQLGYTFVALLFPLGQFRGIQDNRFHQRRKMKKGGLGDVVIATQQEHVPRKSHISRAQCQHFARRKHRRGGKAEDIGPPRYKLIGKRIYPAGVALLQIQGVEKNI